DLVDTVEAGVPLARLQRELDAVGAWLALDPPGRPERSLGSVVATGTAGPLRHGFGPVRDHILGGTIVTGDGRIIKAGGSVVKNVAGYDLTKLQVGGFGAFGVVTELHLRLRARPADRVTLMARGERDRLTHQARALMERRLAASALELLSPAAAAEAQWVLALEITGTDAAVAAEAGRATESAEVPWDRLEPERAAALWSAASRAPLGGDITIRLGVFPDGIDEIIDLLEEALDTCVHCGFCLPACPTYLATGDESDSPRGRILLMRALERGELPPEDPAVREHLDACLGCRGCEPVCPSGVGYGRGLEAARERLAAANGLGLTARTVLGVFGRKPLWRPIL